MFNKINKNIYILGIVSFLNDMSTEMIRPIFPMFIMSLGGTESMVGLIAGIRDGFSNVLKLFFGWFSDKIGVRKPFVFAGYLTSAIFKLFLGLSKNWGAVLVFGGLERTGKGLRTAPHDALISEYMPKKRGQGFGIHRAMDTAGAIMGSFFAFLLYWFLKLDFRTIVIIAAIISFSSLIPLKYVKEKKLAKLDRETLIRLNLKGFSVSLKMFIVVGIVFGLSNFSYMFFLLRAKGLFDGRLSVAVPILLYILFNIFYALFAVPFGNLSDRLGRKKVLIMGYMLYAITCAGFALFNSLAWYIVLFALYGLVKAIVEGNQRAFVSDISSYQTRGIALGTFHTAVGLAALPASLIAGFLWKVSPLTTFMYGFVVSLLSVVLFMTLSVFNKKQD